MSSSTENLFLAAYFLAAKDMYPESVSVKREPGILRFSYDMPQEELETYREDFLSHKLTVDPYKFAGAIRKLKKYEGT